MDKPRVLIVEDEPRARDRLAEAIRAQDDLELVGTREDFESGLAALMELKPQILLQDLGLPDGDGADIIRAIAREGLDTEAMVITVFGDERHVVDALAAGAGGYLLKDDSYTDIGESIRQLLAGGAPISPAIARHLLKRFQPPSHSQSQSPPLAPPPAQNPAQPRTQPHAQLQAQSPLPERLTNREQEILKSIAKGYTAKEIAELEGVTYYTVTTHVKNIYRKLAVNSRTEAIFEAIQLGLIQPQSPTR